MTKSKSYGGYWTGGFMQKRVFMVGAGDGGGGGGGGAGGDKPEFLTEAKFNELFHKASTEREKRFEAKITKALGDTIGTKLDEFRQLIVDSPADGGGSGGGGGGGGGNNQNRGDARMSPEVEAVVRQAQKDAKEANDRAKKWEAEAQAEKTRVTKNEERQAIQALLNGNVKPAMLDMLVDQMHSKNIERDPDTQTILWKDADGGKLPLKEGVASWLKSDIGKEFAPPRQAQGTGSRGNNGSVETNSLRSGPMDSEKLGAIVLGSIPGQR